MTATTDIATRRGSVIVTGANAGLGFQCAARLVAHDWHVILACRSQERGEAARAQLAQVPTLQGTMEVCVVDMADMSSVRKFAEHWKTAPRPPLRSVVCNAAVQIQGPTRRTPEGLELTFATNHLGHFLLARLLLAEIEEGGRVIFVASDTHDPANLTFMPAPALGDIRTFARGDSFTEEPDGVAGRRRYTTSKLCNVLCAYEFDRRLRSIGAKIAVHAFDPGFMPTTSLAREYGPLGRFAMSYVLPILPLFVPNAHRVPTSARRLADLVEDPSYARVSGRYFSRGKELPSSKASYDETKARELWDVSCDLTGVTPVL